MRRRPPESKRSDPLVPSTPRCRAEGDVVGAGEVEGDAGSALGRRGRVVGRGSAREAQQGLAGHTVVAEEGSGVALVGHQQVVAGHGKAEALLAGGRRRAARSEEHTSELQSLMRISYAVFCLKKKIKKKSKKAIYTI